MANALTPQDEFFALYTVALNNTFQVNYSNDQWAEAAHNMALVLMTKAKLPTGAAKAPNMPDVLPEGVAGHRFGPMFAGWDEGALTQVLVAVQMWVLGTEHGGTEDQLKSAAEDVWAAIRRVAEEHAKLRAAAQAKKAAGG
jgi:hypothetical protein